MWLNMRVSYDGLFAFDVRNVGIIEYLVKWPFYLKFKVSVSRQKLAAMVFFLQFSVSGNVI